MLAAAARAGHPAAACLVAIEGSGRARGRRRAPGPRRPARAGAVAASASTAQRGARRRLGGAPRLAAAPAWASPCAAGELLGDRVERALEAREALVEAVDPVLDALQALGDRPQAPREALDVGGRRDVERAEGDLLGLAAFSRASKARAMAPLMSGFSSRSCASLSEGVLALSGEALAQAVAAGLVVHAPNATVGTRAAVGAVRAPYLTLD